MDLRKPIPKGAKMNYEDYDLPENKNMVPDLPPNKENIIFITIFLNSVQGVRSSQPKTSIPSPSLVEALSERFVFVVAKTPWRL